MTKKRPILIAIRSCSMINSTGEMTIISTPAGNLLGSISQVINSLVIGNPIIIPRMKTNPIVLILDLKKSLDCLSNSPPGLSIKSSTALTKSPLFDITSPLFRFNYLLFPQVTWS